MTLEDLQVMVNVDCGLIDGFMDSSIKIKYFPNMEIQYIFFPLPPLYIVIYKMSLSGSDAGSTRGVGSEHAAGPKSGS